MYIPDCPEVLVLPDEYAAFYALFHGFILIWGLADLFFGFKIFKLTLSFLGSFAGMAGGLLLVGQVENPELWMWIVGILVGGILGGALAYNVFQVGVFALGFYAGVLISTPFLESMLSPDVLPYIILLTGVVFGLLAINLSKIMLITGTAITGAFRVVYGTYFFIGGWNLIGLLMYPEYIVNLLGISQMLFALTLGTAGSGIVFQFYQNPGRKKKKSSDEDAD